MLAFTDAWLPPPQAVVDRPPPVVAPLLPISGLFPTSCLHERRPHPVLLAWRRRRSPRPVPSFLLLLLSPLTLPFFWIDGFGGSTDGGCVGRNLYEYFTSIPPPLTYTLSLQESLATDRSRRRSVRNFQKVRSGARSGDGGGGGAVALAAMLPMEQGLRLVLQVTDVRPAAGALRRSQVRARVLVAFMAHLIRARAIRAGTIIRVLDHLFIDSNINTRHQHKELPRDEATFGYVNEAKETKSSSSLCHKME